MIHEKEAPQNLWNSEATIAKWTFLKYVAKLKLVLEKTIGTFLLLAAGRRP